MRYMIIHATEARWEAGEKPSSDLISRVGSLLGDMKRAGALLAGEGLRATSQGVRLRLQGGKRTITPGPFPPGPNELPDGFAIIRTGSLREAVEWAARFADVKDDVEIDVRPVTEPWDIGFGQKPPGHTTTRWMLLRKADADTESGRRAQSERKALGKLLDEMQAAGVLLASELLAPSARGRRYKNSDGQRSVIDGPFAESKELIAGYVLLRANSLEEAAAWAPRYQDAVDSHLVDLREVEEPAQLS